MPFNIHNDSLKILDIYLFLLKTAHRHSVENILSLGSLKNNQNATALLVNTFTKRATIHLVFSDSKALLLYAVDT